MRLDGTAADRADPNAPTVTLMYWMPPLDARGREVRLGGWVRTQDGAAPVVTLQSWSAGSARADTVDLGGSGDERWLEVAAAIVVDSAAHSLVATIGLQDRGTAWFDGLSVDLAGHRPRTLPVAREPEPRELAWLADRVHPLIGVDPPSASSTDSGAYADLQPVADVVDDARLVALGESTHGTSEFFRAKHRLLRFLVERVGFRLFLIEANQLAVERIDAYVRGKPGQAADAMRTLFGVWNTEEMRGLIQWMRAYNDRHPDGMVRFAGFDMQDPTAPIDSVHATLRALAPELADTVRELHADYRAAWDQGPYPHASSEVRRSWLDGAARAREIVAGAIPTLLEESSDSSDSTTVEWLLQNAEVVRQAAAAVVSGRLATRDSAMAANVMWTLDRRFPGERAVLWAHDSHISEGRDGAYDYFGGGSMGSALSGRLGADYVAVGLLTHEGAWRGYLEGSYVETPLFPAPAGSLEHALHGISIRTGAPVLFADLRGSPGDAETHPVDSAARWLLEGRPIRMLGFAAEDWGFAYPIAVGRQFDAVLFVDRSTPSEALRQ